MDDNERIQMAKDACKHERSFRFLETSVRLLFDDLRVLSMFEQMYSGFRIMDQEEAAKTFTIVMHPMEGMQPFVAFDDNVHPLLAGELLSSHVYMIILNGILGCLQSHYLIHAGAIEHNGACAILLGGSGFGKTTLILELASMGAGFLSDEFACLERTGDKVHPFPRAMSIRDGAFELFGFLKPETMPEVKNIGRGHKRLLDPANVPDIRIAGPAKLKEVFVLSSGEEEDAGIFLDVALAEPCPPLHEKLLVLPGVSQESSTERDGYVAWRYRMPEGLWQKFTDCCEEYRSSILYYDRIRKRPDFSKDASLTPLKKSRAAMMMLTNLRNRAGLFGGNEEFEKQASRTFFAMAGRLKNVRCHKLVVGNLQSTADLVLQTLKEEM